MKLKRELTDRITITEATAENDKESNKNIFLDNYVLEAVLNSTKKWRRSGTDR